MRATLPALPLLLAALLLAPAAAAQGAPPAAARGPAVQFNGLGRAYVQQAGLGGRILETDTSSARALADGEFVLDLAANAQPNAVTEVQGVLRLRNEFGGFFGAGVTVELRELWARGIIADALAYRVGDMDLALTPYTLFLPEPDGTVNTPEVFAPLLERVYYEEFYTGRNTRRLQGASLDFGLAFDQGLDEATVRAFLARIRPTDFADTPTRFVGGGRLGVASPVLGAYGTRAQAGLNLTSVWDDLNTGRPTTGIRNAVATLDAHVRLLESSELALALSGEAGRSVAARLEARSDETLLRESDTFLEAGLEADLRPRGLTLSARAINVGPDFFSAAAQSRRVDYAQQASQFTRLGNDGALRPAGLFDLTRDPALYTFRVEEQLMAYDPRYANAQPYGAATPNRRGARLAAAYAPAAGALGGLEARLSVALLREIRGQGTEALKRFALVRAAADVPLAPLVGYRRALTLSLGAQAETTRRRGADPIEDADLSSLLLEAGLAAELYDRLDVLAGAKTRTARGQDYVPVYRDFNDVRDFRPFEPDDREALLGLGLRYRFRPDAYLTVQLQHYGYADVAAPEAGYRFGQVFALYSLRF